LDNKLPLFSYDSSSCNGVC